MKLALLGLTALFPVALAQGPNTTYLAGLAQALSSAGLTQLLNSTTSINGTTAGSQLLTELSNGNYTVFAPDNAARKPSTIRVVHGFSLCLQTINLQLRQLHVISPPTQICSQPYCRIMSSVEISRMTPPLLQIILSGVRY